MMRTKAFLLAAGFLLAAIAPSAAQTMSYADAISQLAAACGKDVRQYCKGVELGGGRLKACLDANAARVSPQCQQVRMMVYQSISRRAAAQRDIGDICSGDIERLCGTSHADAHLVECLVSVSPAAMSPACSQAFTDTGWRTERAQQ
jgi:hypothetical protein